MEQATSLVDRFVNSVVDDPMMHEKVIAACGGVLLVCSFLWRLFEYLSRPEQTKKSQ